MARINEITIWGFKEKGRIVTLRLTEHNISVVYGPNGIGKTTILNIINAIFSKDEVTLNNENVSAIEINFTDDESKERTVKIIRYEEEVDDDDGISYDDIYYDWLEFESSPLSSQVVLYLGIDRGTTDSIYSIAHVHSVLSKNPLLRSAFKNITMLRRLARDLVASIEEDSNPIPSYLAAINSNEDLEDTCIDLKRVNISSIEKELIEWRLREQGELSSIILNCLFDLIAISLGSHDTPEAVFTEKEKDAYERYRELLADALPDGAFGQLKAKLYNILRDESGSDILTHASTSRELRLLILKMTKEVERLQPRVSLSYMIDKYNSFLAESEKMLVVEGSRAYIDMGDVKHPLKKLSSGERHLLTFIFTVYAIGSACDTILIDEPEISLHVKWQRRLMPTLAELAPRAQFIAASHSPSLVHKRLGYLTEIQQVEI